ncbi:acetyltransferase [Mangrovimonas yunxiaonensis]|uniref:Acetyltransferase n=1 Tax=Mangrovimonas yunxiaonensis TaxID=1197477 RepID=A0A084TJZ3_9FLAO|nr:acetyltransferase [Mangrovimonas yunxiaonensis]KFB01029.1 acetyltransferase [Mangrovimonas yunxiaonensis]KFB01670.1 acetyltransferase [Mangrovimonas yunxiaonensis]GGH35311.1 acetyltransferase [Mangrovimonas yunxiaonensis]
MYLFGASGHGKVIAEIAEACQVKIDGFIDADTSKLKLLDYEVIHQLPRDAVEVIITIGDNATRKQVAIQNKFSTYSKLIHPSAVVSKRVKIKAGTVVMAGAVINSDTQIGAHCIINTNASVDHDCIIEDFVHISPNVALAGGVTIGEGTHVGIGASIIPGVTVGKWCTIGAGAVVIEDIPDGATAVGIPAKPIKFANR